MHYHNACLWDFKFDNSVKSTLNDSIFEDDLYLDFYPFIESVSGISLYKCEENSLVNNITDYLKKDKAVIIHFDIYYYPLNDNFNNNHHDHYFLITGYNEQKDCYICVDSFYFNDITEISRKFLEEGLLDIIGYDVLAHPNKKKIYPAIISALVRNVSNNSSSEIFKGMIRMAERILNMKHDEEFAGYTNVKTMPLFMKIQNIVLNRIALSELCKVIANDLEEAFYLELSKSFNSIYMEWNMLLVMMMKYFVTRKSGILKNCYAQLKKIISYEVKAAEMLNLSVSNLLQTHCKKNKA